MADERFLPYPQVVKVLGAILAGAQMMEDKQGCPLPIEITFSDAEMTFVIQSLQRMLSDLAGSPVFLVPPAIAAGA